MSRPPPNFQYAGTNVGLFECLVPEWIARNNAASVRDERSRHGALASADTADEADDGFRIGHFPLPELGSMPAWRRSSLRRHQYFTQRGQDLDNTPLPGEDRSNGYNS